MSSRALRKLKGNDELEIAPEELEEDDLFVSSQKSRRKKKNPSEQERSNAFDVVGFCTCYCIYNRSTTLK